MGPGHSPPLTDEVDLRFRKSTLATGVWLTLAIGVAGIGYVALTWDVDRRPALLALSVTAIERHAGTQFDATCVAALVDLVRERVAGG